MLRNWRTVALIALVAAVLAVAWGASQMQARREAETELAARYQQSFFEAVDRVENVEVLLAKGLLASTPEQVAQIFSDVREEAMAAQASLTQLPLLQGTLLRTGKFLTQVGDFGFTLAKKAAAGRPPDQDEMDLVRMMQKEASFISATLNEIQEDAAKGTMPWEQIRRRTNARLRGDSKELDRVGFTRLDEHFDEIPVIQYDGPFSDHVLQRQPKGLTGDRVSEAEAEEIALEFAPVESRPEYVATAIRRVEGGDIPAYTVGIRRQGEESNRIVLDVSMKGGHVVWMLDKRPVRRTEIDIDEAVSRARRFLESRGFDDMTPTYFSQAENRAVIPFVPRAEGVLIYPDLVKVTVALDTGEIVGFEALGYLMAHTDRAMPEPRVSADEAVSTLDSPAEVTGDPRLALIPTETLDEVLTWEIPVRRGNEGFLVYVDAETGKQERILRLVHTEEGRLTI